ncbi:hypothetical protein [Spirillospora sp. CA-128828]|uniref:hypothetical protein n=1 Tax=Spirillospora sp. CA-128828 TaxID=3240033 RepID=UPI003D921A74
MPDPIEEIATGRRTAYLLNSAIKRELVFAVNTAQDGHGGRTAASAGCSAARPNTG